MQTAVVVPYTQSGMSNAELAAVLKVTPALASRIRRGIGPVSVNTLVNLHEYGVDASVLLQAVKAYRNEQDSSLWVQMFLDHFGSPRYTVVEAVA